MNKTGRSIVNITSLNSALVFLNNPEYVSSKVGLKMLIRYFSVNCPKYNIQINNIGTTYT